MRHLSPMRLWAGLPLRTKWITALVLTSLSGIGLSFALVSALTMRAFDQLLIGRIQADLAETAQQYYISNGSLDGLDGWLAVESGGGLPGLPPPPPGAQFVPPPGLLPANRDGNGSGQGGNGGSGSNGNGGGQGGNGSRSGENEGGDRNPSNDQNPGLVVIDGAGKLIFPNFPGVEADQVIAETQGKQQVLLVDGQAIGAIAFIGQPPELDQPERAFVIGTQIALAVGGVSAVAASVVVGAALSGALLRPIRALRAAAQRMGEGSLVQRVEVRTRDEIGALAQAFNDLSDRLARSQALRRQMTADIAHELRSPLMVISGTLEGLRDGTFKPTATRFETLHDQARQLGRLIDDLRTLSLADAGELRLTRAPIAPADLVSAAAETFSAPAASRNLALAVDPLPGGLPTLHIDRERIMQVLANLIGNALRYATSRISLRAAAEGAGVAFTVADDGPGIPADKLPYLFERFYRADEARDDGSGGTGLGLAIARSIVLAHGGDIRIESTVGQGTQVLVWLPAA